MYVQKTKQIKSLFVKTSSIVCMFRKPNRSNPYTFGENDWTDLDWDKTTDYFVSKTRAEKAAWDLMESKGLKNSLTCINPGFVLGDFLNEKKLYFNGIC